MRFNAAIASLRTPFIAILTLGCAGSHASVDGASTDRVDAVDRAPLDANPSEDAPLDGDAPPDTIVVPPDAPFDQPDGGDATPDQPIADAVLDVFGDLPRVVLPMGKAGTCNELYVNTVVPVTTHTTPPPWPLRRGPIPPGYYVLIAADDYPTRQEDGGFPFAWTLRSQTVRVRPDRSVIELAYAVGTDDSMSSLYRQNCEFNLRATIPEEVCPTTCVNPVMARPGVPGFLEYEVTGDLLRIQRGTNLLTLQRVGPP